MTYTRFTVQGQSRELKKPSYIKNNTHLKSSSKLYSVKYPEHIYVADDSKPQAHQKETEQTLDFVFSKQEQEKEKETEVVYAYRQNVKHKKAVLALCSTLLVFFGSLIIYFSGAQAPDYVQNAFMFTYTTLEDKYEQVFYKIKNGEQAGEGGKQQNLFTPYYSQKETTGEPLAENSVYDTSDGSFIANAAVMESESGQSLSENTETSSASAYDELDQVKSADALIVSKNFSRGSDKVYAHNETSLALDTDALAVSGYPISAYNISSEDPIVLIVHTHGTECYSDSTPQGDVRTTDKNTNVVRVGKELSDILNLYGIPTIHSETMHDEISYITSYQSSRKEIAQMLELYPSIKYVIDLHRDAVPDENGSRVKPLATINGEECAQIMLVMGTNAGGGNHPYFKDNLTVAAHLQKNLNELYPGLARPINVRSAIFNQNLAKGSLLLEVGSDANTLDEALAAVRIFARGFAQTVIKGN